MSEQAEGHSGEQGAGEGQGEGQPKAEKYKVVVSGQEMEVPLAELLNGYQRQADYTKKSQELSARNKSLDARIEEEAMKLYLEAIKKGDEGGKTDKPKDDNPLGTEVASLKERLDKQEQARIAQEADRELDGHLKAVLAKYPKADSEKLLISFYKEAGNDTDVAEFFRSKAESLHKAAEAYDQKIIDSYIERRRSGGAGVVESGGSAAPTGKPAAPAATFEEARERAEKRIAAAMGH